MDLSLSDRERALARHLAVASRWLGIATLTCGVGLLLYTAVFLVLTVPAVGPVAGVMWILVGLALVGLALAWQGTRALEAGRAFGELVEMPWSGMVAAAFGRIGAYFMVDACIFLAPIVLAVAVCGVAIVGGLQ